MLKDRATQVRHSAMLAWRCCLYTRTALHWAIQLSLPAQRDLRDLHTVLHCVGNTFCSRCQVVQSTWQLSKRKSSMHVVIFWISVPNNLEMWFWDAMRTIGNSKAAGHNVSKEFDFTFPSLPKDQAELQSPRWTEGKDCTCPTYLGKSMRL